MVKKKECLKYLYLYGMNIFTQSWNINEKYPTIELLLINIKFFMKTISIFIIYDNLMI